jgi:hypothetical protein
MRGVGELDCSVERARLRVGAERQDAAIGDDEALRCGRARGEAGKREESDCDDPHVTTLQEGAPVPCPCLRDKSAVRRRSVRVPRSPSCRAPNSSVLGVGGRRQESSSAVSMRPTDAASADPHGYEQSARHRCFSWMRERRGLRSRAAGRLLLVRSGRGPDDGEDVRLSAALRESEGSGTRAGADWAPVIDDGYETTAERHRRAEQRRRG